MLDIAPHFPSNGNLTGGTPRRTSQATILKEQVAFRAGDSRLSPVGPPAAIPSGTSVPTDWLFPLCNCNGLAVGQIEGKVLPCPT
jgi:hypothetical protein